MQTIKISTIIFLASLAVACGKNEPMYNNPKGVLIYKDGESLTDLAKRIMGAKIDSLGIALDQDRSTYESKPFLITGTFNQPGHPIFDVQLSGCNINKKISLGCNQNFERIRLAWSQLRGSEYRKVPLNYYDNVEKKINPSFKSQTMKNISSRKGGSYKGGKSKTCKNKK
jgi:hypothetical protein